MDVGPTCVFDVWNGVIKGHTKLSTTHKSDHPPTQSYHAHTSLPLPPHSLSPHDVVALRPGGKGKPSSASDGTHVGAALAQGVVYRIRDDSVVVALDEAPDTDLEGALRVDRLGNEV